MCGLSNLAKKKNITLVVITEVLSSSEDKVERPSLKDFRKAMAIPNAADMLMLLYRKKISEVDEEDGLIIAKNKRGELRELEIKKNNHTGEYFCEK